MLKEELEVIKGAIINEIEGYEFYRMASQQAEQLGSKEALLMLAEEELKHTEYLRLLFDKIKSSDSDDFELAYLSNPPSPNIYNWEKISKSSAGLAMSVFGVGIQMEKSAIEYYQKARDRTSIEAARTLYGLLIGWEKVHLDQFTQQYQVCKEEWWNDQGFSPF